MTSLLSENTFVFTHASEARKVNLNAYMKEVYWFLGLGALFCCSLLCSLDQPCKTLQALITINNNNLLIYIVVFNNDQKRITILEYIKYVHKLNLTIKKVI